MSRDAVIVSTARTPLTKAARGAFNNTTGATLGAYSIRAAVERAGLEGGEIDDVVMGCAVQQGSTGTNVGRLAALRAGLPVSVPAMTIDRQCSSGLMSIATAAKQIIVDKMDICVGAGVESISKVVGSGKMFIEPDRALLDMHPDIYMPMIGTAEVVAKRYNIGREAQDEYSLRSQQRTAAAQAAGKFDDEIVPCAATMAIVDKETKEVSYKDVTADRDDCNRPDTTLEGLASLKPVMGEGNTVTAGNASQLSDGSSACVVMEAKVAEKRGLTPLGRYVAMAVAGTEPDEMGIGPVFAIPKLLERTGLKMDDIGLWELNEAFAVQVLYCRDKLGIPDELLNVNGGSISIGHPFG
ncbi:MAG: acetyl-CoA C-acyltransferase, partial [Sphingomonadales bacterium]|nr:acetyl-CoA C-acyltransferase [Sphingomonadales bacterium]